MIISPYRLSIIATHERIIALRSAGHATKRTAELAGCSESQVERIWTMHQRRLNPKNPCETAKEAAPSKFVVGDFVRLTRDRSVTLKVICIYPPVRPGARPSYGCQSVFSLIDGYTPDNDFVGTLLIYKEYQLTREYQLAKVASLYNVIP